MLSNISEQSVYNAYYMTGPVLNTLWDLFNIVITLATLPSSLVYIFFLVSYYCVAKM